MKRSPIYCHVNVPDRATVKDFGAGPLGFSQDIRVGTGSNNSHSLACLNVTRNLLDNGRVEFCLYLDGQLIKRGILNGSDFKMVAPTL